MINIANPMAPTFAGCYAETKTGRAGTGYIHDTQCTIYKGPDAQYRGREICFNSAETALSIADVSDKQAPKTLSIANYPNVAYAATTCTNRIMMRAYGFSMSATRRA